MSDTSASKKSSVTLTSSVKVVDEAREKLENMLSDKRDLEVQIENLEARMKTLQAAQTATSVQLDNSQLARAKKLVATKHEARLNEVLGPANRAALLEMLAKLAREF